MRSNDVELDQTAPTEDEAPRPARSMALVTVGVRSDSAVPAGLGQLAASFRAARLPVIHAIDGPLAPELLPPTPDDLDLELLEDGGVQTLGPSEMAIGLPGPGAFDATPLDALLRSLGIETVVIGGVAPSGAISTSVRAAELRGYRPLLATQELAVTLGAHISAS